MKVALSGDGGGSDPTRRQPFRSRMITPAIQPQLAREAKSASACSPSPETPPPAGPAPRVRSCVTGVRRIARAEPTGQLGRFFATRPGTSRSKVGLLRWWRSRRRYPAAAQRSPASWPATGAVPASAASPAWSTTAGGSGPQAQQQRQLTQHVRRPHHRDQVLPSVRSAAPQLQLAGEHDVETVPRLAFAEDHLALAELDRLHFFGERLCGFWIYPLEDPAASQYLVHRPPPVARPRARTSLGADHRPWTPAPGFYAAQAVRMSRKTSRLTGVTRPLAQLASRAVLLTATDLGE